MKYFEISYSLTDGDRKTLEDMQNKTYLKMKLRSSWLYLSFAVIFVFFKQYSFSVVCLALGIIDAFLPVALNAISLKKMNKSPLQQREIKLEFYDNHLVFFKLPNEKFKGTEERHFPFDEISAVMESAEYYYFIFGDGSTITLPKGICGEENLQMIENLIENLFSGEHIKI